MQAQDRPWNPESLQLTLLAIKVVLKQRTTVRWWTTSLCEMCCKSLSWKIVL